MQVSKPICDYMGRIAEHILEGGKKPPNPEAGTISLYIFCLNIVHILYIFCTYFVFNLYTFCIQNLYIFIKCTGEAEILINLLPTALDNFLGTEIQKLMGAGHEDIDERGCASVDGVLQFSEVLYVQNMYKICTKYVQNTSICTKYVQNMYKIRTKYVQNTLTFLSVLFSAL